MPGRCAPFPRAVRPAAWRGALLALACTNGSFRKNRACVGTVVVARSAVVALGSAPSKKRRNGCRLIALRHEIHAAPVVVVKTDIRAVLGIRPAEGRRKRMPARDGAVELPALGEYRVPQLLGILSRRRANGE